MKLNLGFLASHNGTDMQAIIEATQKGKLNAEIKVVISNNSGAPALACAQKHSIPNYHISSMTTKNEDESIRKALKKHNVSLILLSGYMKKIGPKTLETYKNRILNVHPALLPKFSGLYGDAVHEAVIKNNEKATGATIHLVDEEFDHGKIIAQKSIKIGKNYTVFSLKKHVQTLEKALFLKVLQDLASDRLDLDAI